MGVDISIVWDLTEHILPRFILHIDLVDKSFSLWKDLV